MTLQIENDSNPAENDSNFDSNYTDLTEKEAKVLEVLRKNNDVSARQMSDNTGISISTVNRIYKILKEKGYIDRKNKTRGAWNILK